MEEVQSAAGGAADLLMECDEEEQKVWPQPLERDEEEEGGDEALQAAAGPAEEDQDPAPDWVIPIPVQPVSSCSPPPHSDPLTDVKASGAPLAFKVNGWLVSLLPGGDGVQLKVRAHPGGSASGFNTVQIPVTLTQSHHSNTTAPQTPTSTTAPTPPPAAAVPEADPTPIITGVVSGEAAQRVLSDHNVNFESSPPPTLTAPRTTAPSTKTRPAAPPKLPRKGPVSPPNCVVCMSQYKLIKELRGFMCLCSPDIAQSLRSLRRRMNTIQRRRNRKKQRMSKTSRDPQTSSKVSRTRPGLSASKVVSPLRRTGRPSDDFLSDQFTSPLSPSSTRSPHQAQHEPALDPPHGKLVILVEDFYYGSAPGRSSVKPNVANSKFTGPYRCIHCPKTLRNNLKLMSHMQEHSLTMSQQDRDLDSLSTCPHCFRHFHSPFKLQCHLEAVHSQRPSTAKCKICELEFGSEPAFLWHMKSTHKPGEMPYVCQVCDFRSSFYSDVWSHFQQVHADTKHLLCQYCLRVLRSNTCYQQHFARHQKKHVFGCEKCRLHFLFVKERIDHKRLHHRTHVRPPQLTGLKPGTKVTVRTYSVVGGSVKEEGLKKAAPCKVVDVDPPPPTQEAPKRKPVASLGPLLSGLGLKSEAAGVSRPSQRCVECLSSFQDFGTHFPSLVHCSLCRFITCCSTSYANHMINNHATCRKKPQYPSIFQPDPRLSQRLRCVSCSFSTCRGDLMANHLTERPEHRCVMLPNTEPSVDGAGTKTAPQNNSCSSVTSSVGWAGGAFIPIHLLASGQTSTQLSVKPLSSPSSLSSPPAMTILFLGPRPQPDKRPVSPLSASQLSAALSSLCHGLPQASRRHQTPPATIRSWVRQQEGRLSDRKWCWRTEKLAEWVLNQREQQLSVGEDVMLLTAKRALGEDAKLADCYSWAVDFLLRHELSLQPADGQRQRGRLPRNIRETCRKFMSSLSSQVLDVPPHRVASMDEFSIFIDSDRFSNQDPSSFQLFGSPEDKPTFDVVLSALSDGTFLPPLLFFRGTPFQVPEGFPDNVLLEARQDGFSDQERLRIWIDKVWRPCVAFPSNSGSVLLVDVHRGHLADEFVDSLTTMFTNIVFIPPGCSCRVQPLDVCVTPVLREFLQARWTQLVSQGGLDGLGLDQLALTLTCWLSEVSSTLNSETQILHRSFASVCNLQEVEDRREAMNMIRALAEALVQPLETSEPPPELEPEPEPKLELLLVMGQDGKENGEVERKEAEPEELSSALRLVFDGDSDQDSFHGFHDD